MNPHDRARQIFLSSRGKLTMAQAYQEMSRRGLNARKRKSLGTLTLGDADCDNCRQVERPVRLPYADN